VNKCGTVSASKRGCMRMCINCCDLISFTPSFEFLNVCACVALQSISQRQQVILLPIWMLVKATRVRWSSVSLNDLRERVFTRAELQQTHCDQIHYVGWFQTFPPLFTVTKDRYQLFIHTSGNNDDLYQGVHFQEETEYQWTSVELRVIAYCKYESSSWLHANVCQLLLIPIASSVRCTGPK